MSEADNSMKRSADQEEEGQAKKGKVYPAYAIIIQQDGDFFSDQEYFFSKPALSDFAKKLLDNYIAQDDSDYYCTIVRAMFVVGKTTQKKILSDVFDGDNFSEDVVTEFKERGFEWITPSEVREAVQKGQSYFHECTVQELNKALKLGSVGIIVICD